MERVEEAVVAFGQALAIHRETKNRRFEGAHTCDYALCLLELKRSNAREVWQRGMEILLAVGDKPLCGQRH